MSRRSIPVRVVASAAAAALAALVTLSALPAASSAAPLPAPTPAPATADAVATGLTLLAAIDVPLTAEIITRMGLTESTATNALADRTAKRYVRLRAVGALPFFATKTARALVERTAAEDADEVVRIQAVTSLARGFGGTDRLGVLTALQALARKATPPVAEAIAAEIALLGPPAGPSGVR